jgi:hypothetical protein
MSSSTSFEPIEVTVPASTLVTWRRRIETATWQLVLNRADARPVSSVLMVAKVAVSVSTPSPAAFIRRTVLPALGQKAERTCAESAMRPAHATDTLDR